MEQECSTGIASGVLPACARATCTDSTDHRTNNTKTLGLSGTPFHGRGAADY